MPHRAVLVFLAFVPAAAQDPPEPVYETVVTALRLPRPIRDVAPTTIVVPRAEIDLSPSLTQDALLRTVPSVATFRRSVSLVADPSSQGLNLRGIGPSAVSRSLVLHDGIIVNDPFGGWVYWRALPRLGLERAEIVLGGGSGLYGNAALGGVVQFFSRPIRGSSLEGELAGGSFATGIAAARGTHRSGSVGAALEAEGLTSQGYPVVAAEARGPIDGDAPSRHLTANAHVEARVSRSVVLDAKVGYFVETERGGTQFTTADVEVGRASLAAGIDLGAGARLEGHVYARLQKFDQARARVGPDRASETLAGRQEVPANDQGASLVWTAPLGEDHVLTAGTDARLLRGTSKETLFPPSAGPDAVVRRNAGGRQGFGGVFLQDVWEVVPALQLSAVARIDGWSSFDAERQVTFASGRVERTQLGATGGAEWSARAGALVRAVPALTLRASLYRAFRAPTLNELYRPFQVGTILTAANESLAAEHLLGGEAGVELLVGRRLLARLTGFVDRLDGAISNVTLPMPRPDGAQRERRNLGAAVSRGVEVSTDWRLAEPLSLVVSYAFIRATVTDAPDAPQLVGRTLPQAPEHRATAMLTFDEPRILSATLVGRWIGEQFEDDLNTLPMSGTFLIDAAVSRRIAGPVEVFLAVENLLDSDYLVGRAGVDTVGQPLTVRAGIRLRDRSSGRE